MMRLRHLLSLFLINCIVHVSIAQNCQTPRNTEGRCVPYQECSYILDLQRKYGSNPPKSIRNFVRSSRCNGADNSKKNVCCDLSYLPTIQKEMIFTSNGENYETTLNPNGVAVLKQFNCGITNTNYVSFGNKSRVAEFPWMALLRYDNPNQPFQCGGSLVSNRYVITAAHCMVKTINKLIGVRLGEHDISKEKDCVKRLKTVFCYSAQDFEIEKIIPHPQYSSRQHINDVGLIKLRNNVQFQNHISPVCLPITNNAALLENYPDKYILTGWGLTELEKQSNIMLKAEIPSKPRSYCQSIFKKSVIKNEHICAGGVDRVDSCYGDSGGPLVSSEIYEYTARFILYGIVSVGVAKCGDINSYPGVYTNVVQFMPWITDQISY